MSTLPKLDGVSESTLKEFLRLAAGNFTVDDKKPLPKILDTEGRAIRVHVTGFRLNWHSLAEGLLGNGRPCEEFRVDGNYINARLKTTAQRDADDLAGEVDDKYPDAFKTKIQTWWPYFDDVAESEPRNARQIGQASRERKMPGGAAADVMRLMKTKYRLGTVPHAELVDVVKKGMAPRPDAEGKDRRAKYIRTGIDKLVGEGLLYMHADDRIGLSELVEVNDDEDTDA